MSKIRQKSDFNIDAAEQMLKEAYYAPSVHCSYYSCFQLLKFTIKDFFGIDYDTQSVNIASSNQNTHQYVLNYVSSELRNLAGFEESRDFKRTFKDLKQFRLESDYENIEIGSEKGNEALDKAKEIRTYIIKNFNV
nr:HEPN domain-containing protein [uncultured Draconibacterium sp.]